MGRPQPEKPVTVNSASKVIHLHTKEL